MLVLYIGCMDWSADEIGVIGMLVEPAIGVLLRGRTLEAVGGSGSGTWCGRMHCSGHLYRVALDDGLGGGFWNKGLSGS